DGQYRWILDRGVPRYTPSGEFAGFIGSCVDITDRKRLEIELRRAIRVRDDFLSIAAHGLRTPLTAQLLQLERALRLLQRNTQSSDQRVAASTAAAVDQARRLTALVDELLDVSRIASGTLRLERQPIDLAALSRDVVSR